MALIHKSKKVTLVKADIVKAIYQEVGLSKRISSDLVDSFLCHISESLVG